jgi:NAD(P)-dependent dehydrogenase (short-subunit alcohol dehydrogenase family)
MTGNAGKVAVVTGGSRGIGRAVADRLAADGFDVLLVSRSAESLQRAAADIGKASGRRVLFCAADLRTEDEAKRVAKYALDQFGRVDVLVNCAGATRGGPFTELGHDVWLDGFALKFFGAVHLSRALWPALKAAHGTVVNIGGGFARTPDPDFMIGGAVNAALANFSKALSKQGLRDDVNVNIVHPGTTVTERMNEIVRTRAAAERKDPADVAKSMVAREGIRRLGQPEEVAHLVSFLCDPKSRHIQGSAITIDGGATASNF